MIRIDSAENVLRGDVLSLFNISHIIRSMEIEASVSMALKVDDATFSTSSKQRVALIEQIARGLDGSSAKGCAEEVLSVWGDKGAAIDDYLSKDGSSKTVIKLADKLEAGYYSEDYDGYGWDE